MKKRLSSAFITMIVVGVICAAFAVQLFYLHAPEACAVLSVFAFIFLWVPFMLPDHEKYTMK